MDSNKTPRRFILSKRLRIWVPPLVRISLLVSLVWVAREHHAILRIGGSLPVDVLEIREFLPGATSLRPDHSVKEGLFVRNAENEDIGYAVRTQPIAKEVTGYAGITDTLLVFDDRFALLGIRIRSSEDTTVHVGDVKANEYFMSFFNGMKWDDLGQMDFQDLGVEGVAGSTLTSMGIAEAIRLRVRDASERANSETKIRWRWRDTGLALVLLIAVGISFSHLKSNLRVRRGFQIVVMLYLGIHTGDLLAQSLMAGWAKSGVPFHIAPGLVLLVAAAVLIPTATRKGLYCQQVCPHGAAQEWMGMILPARFKWNPPKDVANALKWTAPSLLLGTVAVTMLNLPFDLAGIEPFDAWLMKGFWSATVIVAIAGLLFSAFVPMGYCRFGCPTGAFLKFVRSRGINDRLGRAELFGFLLLLISLALVKNYDAFAKAFLE